MISTVSTPSLLPLLQEVASLPPTPKLTPAQLEPAEYSTCSMCNETKHGSEFYLESRKGRTYSSRCKVCSRIAAKAAKKARKLFPDKHYKFHVSKGDSQ